MTTLTDEVAADEKSSVPGPKVHKNDDGSYTLTLAQPLTVGTLEYKQLNFRKPLAKDMRALDKAPGSMGQSFELASTLSGVAVPILERLEVPDWQAVNAVLAAFLERGQVIGAS